MATLTLSPDYSASKTLKPKVIVHKFADGYEVRRADGINNKLKEWNLTFRRDRATIDTLDTFLTARGAVEAFNWTDPHGYAGVWVCDEYTEVFDEIDWGTITCTFREVPEVAAP